MIKEILEANKPSLIMLARQGELYSLIPELAKSHGRPQNPKWHPEGTVDEHVRQVVDRAAIISGNPIVVWAALVHDIGKGFTPDDELPHYYQHESLGVKFIRPIGIRLGLSEEYIRFAEHVTGEHMNAHRFLEMRPTTRVKFLRRIWLCNLNDFTLACKADAQGRGEVNWGKEYPQADAIMNAAHKIGKISIAGKSHEAFLQEAAKAIT